MEPTSAPRQWTPQVAAPLTGPSTLENRLPRAAHNLIEWFEPATSAAHNRQSNKREAFGANERTCGKKLYRRSHNCGMSLWGMQHSVKRNTTSGDKVNRMGKAGSDCLSPGVRVARMCVDLFFTRVSAR